MADGLIDMIIPSANFEALTATNNKVAQGKKYVGKDGIFGIGENPVRESPNISLPVNGEILLPYGLYAGGTVGQKISTVETTHVMPSSKEFSISTKDKYMTGVIFIDPLANLKPENIKEGAFVGGVGPGTWKGFIVDDPNTFYYRGTFAPNQKLEEYEKYEDAPILKRTDLDREIEFYREAGRIVGTVLVFSEPVNLTTLKSLKISLMFSNDKYTDVNNVRLGVRLYRNKTITFNGEEYDKEHGLELPILNKDYYSSDFEYKVQKNISIDVSDLSRTAYLSFYLTMAIYSHAYLRIVQFE